jgi:hypothetical protein
METMLIIGLIMVGFNIFMSCVELQPFLRAYEDEKNNTSDFGSKVTFPFRVMGHLPKLIPSFVDLVAMLVLTKLFAMGGGYASGVTGLFASNLLSLIIYFYTHRRKQEVVLEELN